MGDLHLQLERGDRGMEYFATHRFTRLSNNTTIVSIFNTIFPTPEAILHQSNFVKYRILGMPMNEKVNAEIDKM